MPKNITNITGVSLCQKTGIIRIFRSTIKELGDPKYIRFLFNPEKRTLAVQATSRKEAECFRVPKYNSKDWDFKICSVQMLRMIWKVFANDANALMLIVVVFLIVVLAYIPLHTLMNFMHDKKKELINQLNSEIQRADQEEKSQLVKERNDIIAQGAVSTTFFNKMILILSVVLPLIAVIFQGIELLKK